MRKVGLATTLRHVWEPVPTTLMQLMFLVVYFVIIRICSHFLTFRFKCQKLSGNDVALGFKTLYPFKIVGVMPWSRCEARKAKESGWWTRSCYRRILVSSWGHKWQNECTYLSSDTAPIGAAQRDASFYQWGWMLLEGKRRAGINWNLFDINGFDFIYFSNLVLCWRRIMPYAKYPTRTDEKKRL